MSSQFNLEASQKGVPSCLLFGKETINIFNRIYPDFLTLKYNSPAKFFTEMWKRYYEHPARSSQLDIRIFRTLLSTVLYRQGILPFYRSARLHNVPNVEFDFVAYCKECGPVILSAKTSLRERYKQADLEGMMVRQVHRKAKSYLITLDNQAARLVNEKIHNGQVLGLDDVVVASEPKFDKLIEEIAKLNFYTPEKIEVLTGKRLIL